MNANKAEKDYQESLAVEASKRVERRKWKRDETDFKFEAHRDVCGICKNKSMHAIYFEHHNFDHLCSKGAELAFAALIAHKELVGK